MRKPLCFQLIPRSEKHGFSNVVFQNVIFHDLLPRTSSCAIPGERGSGMCPRPTHPAPAEISSASLRAYDPAPPRVMNTKDGLIHFVPEFHPLHSSLCTCGPCTLRSALHLPRMYFPGITKELLRDGYGNTKESLRNH